jgi:hypothetical protein
MATASSLASVGGILNAYDSIAASATDSVLVAASGSKRIRVLSVVINQGDTTPSSVTFNSKGSGAGTTISPALKAAANGGFVLPLNVKGWFSTNRGEALTVTTGAGSTSSVIVTYDVVS